MTTSPSITARTQRPFTPLEHAAGIAIALYVILSTTSDLGATWWRDVLRVTIFAPFLIMCAIVTCGVTAWLLTRLTAIARERWSMLIRGLCLVLAFTSLVLLTGGLPKLLPFLANQDPSVGFAAWSWSALVGILLAVCMVMADVCIVTWLLTKDLVDDLTRDRLQRWQARVMQTAQDLNVHIRAHGLPPMLANRIPKELLLTLAAQIRRYWAYRQEGSVFFVTSRHQADATEAARILRVLHAWCRTPELTTPRDIEWCVDRLMDGISSGALDDANAQIVARFADMSQAPSRLAHVSWPSVKALLVTITTLLTTLAAVINGVDGLLARFFP
jgi:hypothetical protein